ncbi:MAG TPA: hypothetical protein VGG20_00840 [Thermoanaerobaculia bacterium]|jgi:hypothetical protein
MRKERLLFALALTLSLTAACETKQTVSISSVPYQETGPVKDASFAGIRRVSTRITLERNHTQAEIESTLRQVVENLAHRENAGAAIVYAYYPGDNTSGVYTVAMATYGPNGRWEDVGRPGPMQSVIEFNANAFPERQPPETKSATSAESQKRIICNKFQIKVKEEGTHLFISLDTDLPENTQVMVTMGRDYKATMNGKSDTYTEAYLDTSSTVSEWRAVHRVDIQDSMFRTALADTLERSRAMHTNMKVGKISATIDVQFIVPINQANANFGKGNANLGGAVVVQKGSWNLIDKEQSVHHPLKG